MTDDNKDIVDEYFKAMKQCNSISCRYVIFEPATKKEWFFENGKWCHFEFQCDDNDYRLISTELKEFGSDCVIKEMSYEIRMLLSYTNLRKITTVEKDVFSNYITKYEKAHESDPELTPEQFNYDLKQKEELSLKKSDIIANRILTGCLGFIILIIICFGIFILTVFFAPHADAKSKYTQEFIQNFYICKPFVESKYNPAYNSNATYEIKGYAQDGSGKCIYEETNRWLKGANVTTCYFEPKQIQEYYLAMLSPDIQGSVLVKGMPVVGNNEDVTFLKYFNDPKTCQTRAIQ